MCALIKGCLEEGGRCGVKFTFIHTHSGYPFFEEGEEAEAGSVRVSAVVAHKRTIFKTGTIPVLTYNSERGKKVELLLPAS